MKFIKNSNLSSLLILIAVFLLNASTSFGQDTKPGIDGNSVEAASLIDGEKAEHPSSKNEVNNDSQNADISVSPKSGDTADGIADKKANSTEKNGLYNKAADESTAKPYPGDIKKNHDAANQSIVPKLMKFMDLGVEWVLWLLLALGFLTAGVLVERTIFFIIHGGGVKKARSNLICFLKKGDLHTAREYFGNVDNIVSHSIAEVLDNCDQAPEAIQQIFEARLMIERRRLERGLTFVGTVGANAPFIGLFGTVLGIIKAFRDLAIAEQAGPSVVMSGISEALVATAVGLLVAIPAVVIFNIFKAKTTAVLSGTESVFKLLLSRQFHVCFGGPGDEKDQDGPHPNAQ